MYRTSLPRRFVQTSTSPVACCLPSWDVLLHSLLRMCIYCRGCSTAFRHGLCWKCHTEDTACALFSSSYSRGCSPAPVRTAHLNSGALVFMIHAMTLTSHLSLLSPALLRHTPVLCVSQNMMGPFSACKISYEKICLDGWLLRPPRFRPLILYFHVAPSHRVMKGLQVP